MERWEAIARELGDYDLCDGSMVKANSFVPEDDLPGEWVRAEPAGKRIAELEAKLAKARERWQEIVLHRDVDGFADTLDDANGHVILHLRPGTTRNEENQEAFVAQWNAMSKRIAELEAKLAQETANNAILEAKLAYRDSSQVSHSEECWRVHQECAVRRVEELERRLEDVASALGQHPGISLEALLSFISSVCAEARVSADNAERARKLRELLREVAGSGVELETRKYLTVQVSPETWARVQEEAKRDE